MDEWKPRRAEAFDAVHALSADEHIVLAHLDGQSSMQDVANRTGIGLAPLGSILARLIAHGAIAPAVMERAEVPRAAASSRAPAYDARAELEAPIEEPLRELEETPAEGAAESEAKGGDEEDAAATADEQDPQREVDARNYRMIYETQFHPLERDARVAAAAHATGSDLLALCFDADPQVIRAVLQNATAGLDHARLLAFHHKNPSGLEAVMARPELARDGQVQRRLLRNDQLSEALLKRLLTGKRMVAVFKLVSDRDVPERSRVASRGILRQKFASAAAEERAELVLQTEGRALTLLVGQTFDARTTSILCARTITSISLIQNLARFPACPPPLLVHLVKLPMVRRQPQLKKVLLQHPNMPSEMKRQLS